METALTISRRILGSMLIPIQTKTQQVRTFKGIKNQVKCNVYLPAPKRHPVVRFRKGNYRRICQSSAPLGSVCTHPKLCSNSQQSMDEFQLNGGYWYISPLRNSCIGRSTVAPFVRNWRWYARIDESKKPSSNVGSLNNSGHMPNVIAPTVKPQLAHNWNWYAKTDDDAPKKEGPVKESDGRLEKLDAANEKGLFHKINKSKLEQIKALLRNKSMLRGTDNTGKKSED